MNDALDGVRVANLGRNLMEGRLGILTAVFEAASTKTPLYMENR